MKILLGDIMYERNLTARQVEIMTGVSKSTVSRIANNQIIPRLDTLEELAKGLNIKISDLYESDFQ
ncbi:MAG: helix-turn-helix transcriptional regulator [Lachnospiraceae bacterium]|nr:helix-turn-helix transcriptional regulator [Lachnospiraceae bacterium]